MTCRRPAAPAVPIRRATIFNMADLGRRAAGMVAGATRPVRRRLRHPFLPDAPQVVVHCSHHRAGTVWLQRVLGAVAARYGLPYRTGHTLTHLPKDGIVQYRDSREFERERWAGTAFRGSHMIRDPRDVIVSGYHYHLWTSERWVHQARPEYRGRTYQEHLNSINPHEGLLEEIRRSARMIRAMASWDYAQPEFIELRYEETFGHEREVFPRLFRHYGFDERAVESCVDLAERFSFGRVAGRRRAGRGYHLRWGYPGQWKQSFTAEHRQLFDELLGDTVVSLGYELDAGWARDGPSATFGGP